MQKVIFTLVLQLVFVAPSFGQAGGTGNGLVNRMVDKLPYFIQQDAIRKEFKEVDSVKMHSLVEEVNVVILDSNPLDKRGRRRAGKAEMVNDVPTISIGAPFLKKHEKTGLLHVVVLHQLLNLMGLELTDGVNFIDDTEPAYIASIYPVASRLLRHVKEFDVFEPLNVLDFTRYAIACVETDRPQQTRDRYVIDLTSSGGFSMYLMPAMTSPIQWTLFQLPAVYNWATLVRPELNLTSYQGWLPKLKVDTSLRFEFVGTDTQARTKSQIRGLFVRGGRKSRRIVGDLEMRSAGDYRWLNGTKSKRFRCVGLPVITPQIY